ncbi:MAG TPA: glycosyltransferase family 2 protein [Nitrososphaeraceae archaeon]
MGTYFVILTCRNSEDNIREAINSLKDQTIRPQYIIVINDGSMDKTANIIKDIQRLYDSLYLINHPDWGYDIKRVVKNWNEAISFSKTNKLKETEYHLIATDDTVYSKDYIEKLMEYVDSDQSIAIVSGNYAAYLPIMPHGAGRLVRNSFLQESCWKGYYPEKMGYESAILYEANRCSYKYAVLNDARFKHIRPLGKNHKFYEFGASMQTLGYHPIFVLGRFFKYLLTGKVTGRLGAFYMLYYYLTYKPKHDGYDSLYNEKIRQYVRRQQINRLKQMMLFNFKGRNFAIVIL